VLADSASHAYRDARWDSERLAVSERRMFTPLEVRTSQKGSSLAPMPQAHAELESLLPKRAHRPFHRPRDNGHTCFSFWMPLKLAMICFCPWTPPCNTFLSIRTVGRCLSRHCRLRWSLKELNLCMIRCDSVYWQIPITSWGAGRSGAKFGHLPWSYLTKTFWDSSIFHPVNLCMLRASPVLWRGPRSSKLYGFLWIARMECAVIRATSARPGVSSLIRYSFARQADWLCAYIADMQSKPATEPGWSMAPNSLTKSQRQCNHRELGEYDHCRNGAWTSSAFNRYDIRALDPSVG